MFSKEIPNSDDPKELPQFSESSFCFFEDYEGCMGPAYYEESSKGKLSALVTSQGRTPLGNPAEVFQAIVSGRSLGVIGDRGLRRAVPALRGLPELALAYLAEGRTIEFEGYKVGFRGKGILRVQDMSSRKAGYLEDMGIFYRASEPVMDLDETWTKINKVVYAMHSLGMPVGRWIGTPARCFERLVLGSYPGMFPDLTTLPLDLLALAWNCFKGGQWAIEFLGKAPALDSFDQNGSYASNLARLPNCSTRECDWVHSKDYQPDAFYGFLRVEGVVEAVGLSPIIFRSFEEEENIAFNVSASGNLESYYLTKLEYDLIHALGIGRLRILDGWWGTPKSSLLPLQRLMEKLHALRSTPEGNSLYKVIGSTGWGKTAQVTEGKAGRMFNPIYAATVTGMTRAKVFSLIYPQRQGSRGIRLDGGVGEDLELGSSIGEGLGQFKRGSKRDAFFVNPVKLLTVAEVEQIVANDGRMRVRSRLSISQAAITGKSKQLGDFRTRETKLILSPGYRQIEDGLELKDLLEGAVPTKLPDNRVHNFDFRPGDSFKVEGEEIEW